MEKSELSTRDRMCSVAGGMAGLLVDREIPSRLIPFRGEFPLLDMIEAIRFREAIRSTMWIEDLPPKFLYAAAEGSRIARLEREFRHYLSRNGLKSGDFEKLKDAEKSEWLQRWMEADSVSADDLVVKKYRDEATPVSKSLGDPAMPVAEKREIYDDLVSRRAYWDDLCFEFGRVSWEKKLLNLALYIHYGGDLEVVLARYKENHPDYADRIPHSLAYYISYLRTGEATSVLNNFLLERVCLSESRLTALLTAELRERLEEVFRWDGGTNSAWTVGIDYRGEEKMDEIVTALDIEKGREYLIFGNLTIKPFIMETGKSSVSCPLKPKRFSPLKTFNNAPLKSLDRWGYYYFSLFPSVCSHFTDTFSCQLNPVRRMYNTIHNGICYCRVSDCIIPIVRWQLRGDDDGLAPMSVLYYIEQDGSFLGIKVHKEEVIQYEQRAPFDSLEFRFQCAFYFCHLKRTHKFRSIRIICPYALLAGFIPHCCGKEALPGTG